MPISSVTGLLDVLRQYHLLEPEQLDELARGAAPEQPKALAAGLIRRGWLTPYQANQILQGRARELLLESYVLLERLGEGGMGTVFKARNWKLGRLAALKLIRKERLANEEAVRRFHREIRAAAQLSHPNIVLAYDAGEDNGAHFFTMEYVEGRDLAWVVGRHGPLPVAAACDYIRQGALGLQHAHEKGMVHRDVKPHNLLLNKQGVVKLLDLGLAQFDASEDEESSTLTQEGVVMGTVDYIAPEQVTDSHSVDIRADLYSLGCTLHFLLTGRVPFPGRKPVEKLYRHRHEHPVPVEQLRPEVPGAVAAVVRKLLAKQPQDRYQTPAATTR
jgi:serine/threonine protein kinase